MGIIKLTRKGLYEEIWAEPIVKLSQKFGFSDTWLARICKRNRIPRPPRGYWARIQSGQRIPKTPLPKGDDGRIIEIITHDPAPNIERALLSKNRPSKKLLRSIVIPGNQMDPHPLVSEAARILGSVDQDETGLIPPQQGCLKIHVSRDCIPRALNFIDGLIKSLTAMGFEIFLSGNRTMVSKDGVSFNMSISEEMDRRKRLKAADHKLEGYYEFGYRLYEKKAYPSGRLAFSINDLGFESQHKKSWRDTDSKSIEDSLKSIVASLIRITAIKKVLMLEKEAEEKG